MIAPDTPKNAATFLIGKSIKLIKKDNRFVCLVTYADEWQGHVGTIYKASNWEYMGKTKPEPTFVCDGKMTARKAGPVTRTHKQMEQLGCKKIGSFAKHKYRMKLNKGNKSERDSRNQKTRKQTSPGTKPLKSNRAVRSQTKTKRNNGGAVPRARSKRQAA